MTNFNFKLRPYQESAPHKVRLSMVKHKRVLLVAPTGAGKSVIFTLFARKAAMRQSTVIILTHRTELLEQADDLTQGLKGISVVMVETFWNRIKAGEAWPNLLIIDEAHTGNFKKVVDACPQSTYILGLTATPVMVDKKDRLSNYYGEMLELTTISECLENGWLCKYRHFEPNYAISGDSLQVEKGEYTDESLTRALGHSNVEQELCATVAKLKGKIIVFGVNVKHTEKLAKMLNADYCVHSKMHKDERKRQVKEFKERRDRCIMVNCGILTTGFDCPDIKNVVLVRKTKSLFLYLQIIGRGSRNFDGKLSFNVFDFGKNHEEHGLWSDRRDWQYYFNNNQRNPREMVQPTKRCKSCMGLVAVSARICTCCGAPFPVKPKKELQVEVNGISEVAPKTDGVVDLLAGIADTQIKKGYKLGWVYNQVKALAGKISMPFVSLAREYARIKGYSPNWYSHFIKNDKSKSKFY